LRAAPAGANRTNRTETNMSSSAWQVYSLDRLTETLQGKEPQFIEFLRSPALSGAIYRLPAGSRDMQAPHLEDEIYFVVSGHAWLQIGADKREIGPGHILYVRATAEHSFFNIDEDLTLVVIFGPARPMQTPAKSRLPPG
jgi:mannose-6-phosphate isomerase-like protein (cupin superfamily)